MIKVAPSILSADFVNLERDIRSLPAAGADYVHVDVMDGACLFRISPSASRSNAAISRIAPCRWMSISDDRAAHLAGALTFCKAGKQHPHAHVEADTQENTLECPAPHPETVCALPFVKPNTPAEAVLPLFPPLCDLILR